MLCVCVSMQHFGSESVCAVLREREHVLQMRHELLDLCRTHTTRGTPSRKQEGEMAMPKSRKACEKGTIFKPRSSKNSVSQRLKPSSPQGNCGGAVTPTARKGKIELAICYPGAKASICTSRELRDLIRNTSFGRAGALPCHPIDSLALDEVPKT